MIDNSFFEGFEFAMYQSLESAVIGSPDYSYRRICREFSKTFHTPLREVEGYPAGYVLRMVLENRLDEQDREQLLEYAEKMLQSPEEVKSEEAEIQDLIKQFEEEEKNKKAKKKKPEQKQALEKEIDMKFEEE